MLSKWRRQVSPSLVISILALIVAVGGGSLAYAALSQKKVKQITNKQITKRAAKLKVLRAQTAGRADSAGSADTATSATNATNAAQLGGVPAAAFARSDCGSAPGAIKGYAQVSGSGGFSGSFTPVPGYNCSGGTVEARRLQTGVYEVRFVNSPVTRVIGAGLQVQGTLVPYPPATLVSSLNTAPGTFQVAVYNAVNNNEQDNQFTLVAY